MARDELKKLAAREAMSYVRNGMRLGIGTGSTANAFIHLLAEACGAGLKVQGVPTSEASAALCTQLGVPLTTLEAAPELDLAIDGADEVDHQLRLIKGGGGALLREKIVAQAAKKCVIIVDEHKCVDKLGAFGVPVEINRFGMAATKRAIVELARKSGLPVEASLRYAEEKIFVTDEGHYILDCHFGLIDNIEGLSQSLLEIAGVVQHGLFLNIATEIIVAKETGGFRNLAKKEC